MKQHIIPSIVASLVAIGAAVGIVHYQRSAPATHIVVAPLDASNKKLERAAALEWPELSQKEVDAVTAGAKALKAPTRLTIVCANESWCGDVGLNLDNAFESAHWPSEVVYSPMMSPTGWVASSEKIAKLLNDATGDRYHVRVDPAYPTGPAALNLPEYVSIGQKPKEK